jgi:hypothetical protein
MLYVGIDPGLHGAIAVLEDGEVRVRPAPVIKGAGPRGRDIPDRHAMVDLLPLSPALVVVEDVNANPKWGWRAGTLLLSKGIWLGILAARRERTMLLRPQDWQKRMAVTGGKPKARALARARDLFPCSDDIDLQVADAVLLAVCAKALNEKGG